MNKLSSATSPYLVQHANNPVNWYPWGAEALELARRTDRPIFLSIGYSACHWCHVMAHESFEDESIAALMNAHFVNIKVDREERPDLDSLYMAATMAMTGSGGWPMSVFLTPDLHPFYAGTYFPPAPRHNLPSFQDLLSSIARAWREERGEIESVSQRVADHLRRQSASRGSDLAFSPELLDGAAKHLYESYDWGYGGWGSAPKFPQPMTIEFLLGHSLLTKSSDPTLAKAALHALQAMARGGMYDVVGGGFSRYSTDNFWRVPHFEKMLSDNAQLIRAYLHAYQLTREPSYRRVAVESLAFVYRELTGPEGGFYASLDADSEGVEGKFYVWEAAEIQSALGVDWEFFKTAYGITATGNWEEKTVLQRALDDSTLAAKFPGPSGRAGQLPGAKVLAKLAECHSKLLAARAARPRPSTDDKVVTAWNGLMLSAFAEAARLLGPEHPDSGEVSYLEVATRNADFLLTALRPDGQLRRAWRNGKLSGEVFLEDYAALILGLLDLYQTDFNLRWFTAAQELAEELIARFRDPAGGFFDTPVDGETLIVRPKDLQDNATPSGNALAAEALFKLAAFSDRLDYRDLAEAALRLVAEPALRYPTAFGRWLSAADFALARIKQVAILGDRGAPETQEMLRAVRENYRPQMVVSFSPYPPPQAAPALLANRPLVDNKPSAYVCEGFTCQKPVTTALELKTLL
jgi:uncharacterized protein YyaL (SSP411 family)